MKRLLIALLTPLLCIPSLKARTPEKAEDLMKRAQQILFNNPKQASYWALQAANLFPEEECPNTPRAEAMLLHCQAEQLLGNFDMSIKTLYDMQRFIPESNRYLTANWCSLLGRLFAKLGDYNKGIELNDRATAIFKSIGDSASTAHCYSERGVMHYEQNEFMVAEQFLQRALRINRAQRNLKEIAANLNNLCLYEGNTDEKLQLIHEAIVINRNLEAHWSLGENYNNLAKQHYFGEQYASALEALRKGFEYAQSLGARELMRDNYEYSSWIYAAIGQYENAYNSLRRMYALNRQLLSNNRLRNIEQEIAYKRIQDQRHKAESEKQAYNIKLLKRNLFVLGSLLALLIATACLIYIWYKRRKNMQLAEARIRLEQSEREVSELKLQQQAMEMQQKQMELEQQERELHAIQSALDNSKREATEFAVFLSSRNELLDKIRDMIKEAYRMDATAIVSHLKKVNAFITQSQNEKANSSVLLNLAEKNNAFTARLLELHPKLTQGERYLATLLRANMSTKEIAMIKHHSKDGQHEQYRLRKSLCLNEGEDLEQYIRNI